MVGKHVKIGKIPCPQFGLAISPKIPLFVQWMIYGGTKIQNLRTERSTGQNSKWIVSWGFMMISSFLDVLQGTNLNWNPPYSWMQTVKASCRFSISQSIYTVSVKIAGCVSHDLPQLLKSETFSDAAWSHEKSNGLKNSPVQQFQQCPAWWMWARTLRTDS